MRWPRARTGVARERHPGSGERQLADAVRPRYGWGRVEVRPAEEKFHAKYGPHPPPQFSLGSRVRFIFFG